MNVQEIKELLEAFDRSAAVSLEMEASDIRLCIQKQEAVIGKKDTTQEKTAVPAAAREQAAGEQTAEESAAAKAAVKATEEAAGEPAVEAAAGTAIQAPLAGIFYRSASPEADPYVRPGQQVKKGETVGLIEAMKVMNEIPAPFDGEITEIRAENEAFVPFGETLMQIRPKE